jgi:type I restriction enzyme S subunit
MRFDEFFDMLPTNTLSRDKLNSQRGDYQNIHYGDVLIKYPYCLDCNNNEIPYINDGVKFNTTEVKDGDVIFADTAEDDTVGKCVEVLNVGDRRIVSGLHTYFCRPKCKMAPGYLGYFLNSDHFHNQLLPYIAGSKVSSVNRTSISRTYIFYPDSPSAQSRIAAILSSTDKVITSTQKVIAKYKQMKQGLMEDLLKPKEGWKMVKLGDIGEFYVGGDVDKSCFSPYPTMECKYPIYANALVDEGLYGYSSKYEFDKEAVTITGRGDVGKVFYRKPYFSTIIRLVTLIPDKDSDIDVRFLSYAMSKINFIIESTGVPQLTAPQAKKYAVPVPFKNDKPDLDEQQRIANILSGIDAKIAAEERVLEKYNLIKKGLMERLLNEK